jgi:hypothetical protein
MTQELNPKKLDDQGELFAVVVDRPAWSDLPTEARKTATSLLARMLREHRRGECRAANEVEHE